MKPIVLTKTFSLPPVNYSEALRYARTNTSDASSVRLLEECIRELGDVEGKVSYCKLCAKKEDDTTDFGYFSIRSKNLATFFGDEEETILFVATVGLIFDRLVTKYALLSPAKALMFQALGAERVEALCEVFTGFIKGEYDLLCAPRFSPGYGDSPLYIQKDIITLLNGNKNCGVFVNDSFLLSPSKTVTAFMKLSKE